MQHLARMQVDLVGHLLGDLDEEPTVDMHHALRLARRAARVADEERMLGLEGLGGHRLVVVRDVVPPSVAPLVPRGRWVVEVTQDDDVLHAPVEIVLRSHRRIRRAA